MVNSMAEVAEYETNLRVASDDEQDSYMSEEWLLASSYLSRGAARRQCRRLEKLLETVLSHAGRRGGTVVKRISDEKSSAGASKYLKVEFQCEADYSASGSGIAIPDASLFDFVIETGDPRIGIFAASFAAHLLNIYVSALPGEDDNQVLTQVAALIHDYPEAQDEIAKLTESLNRAVANINSAIQELAELSVYDLWCDR